MQAAPLFTVVTLSERLPVQQLCEGFATSALLPTRKYLALRVFLASCMVYGMLWDGATYSKLATANASCFGYLAFFTSWALVTECVYLVLAAVATWMAQTALSPASDATPLRKALSTIEKCEAVKPLLVVVGILQVIAVEVSFVAFFMYWVCVLPSYHLQESRVAYLEQHPATFAAHGVNFLVMAVDICFSRQPFGLCDAVWTVAYSLFYVCFSAAYYLAGGVRPYDGSPAMYPFLDWRRPVTTIACLSGILVMILGMHWAIWSVKFVQLAPSRLGKAGQLTNTV
mmetsp:Transcript_957/g.1943  ORF Transcript_957/g.1943 Transcript_957/m.1943 type:complete len:285 (+) Transcript_957:146-1000(+)